MATDDVQGRCPQTRMDLHLQLVLLFLLLLLLLPLAAGAASDGRVRRGALGSNQLGASQEEVVSGYVERRSSHAPLPLLAHPPQASGALRCGGLLSTALSSPRAARSGETCGAGDPEPSIIGHDSQPPDQAPRALRSPLESVRLTLVLFWWWW